VGFVIAIDGPAASGKGAIATRLGAHYGLPVLDTGLLYRAVGAIVLGRGGDPDDPRSALAAAEGLDPSDLEDESLRGAEAAQAASRVAVHPAVRERLLGFQRDFAANEPGAILDGRDIGTVVAPQAPAKLFVTASAGVRARRRWLELTAGGDEAAYEAILADIRRRDERDSDRAAAPLTAAPDAVLLDTSQLTIDRAFDAARRIVEAARARWEQSRRA
jgi:cytidylate kinase